MNPEIPLKETTSWKVYIEVIPCFNPCTRTSKICLVDRNPFAGLNSFSWRASSRARRAHRARPLPSQLRGRLGARDLRARGFLGRAPAVGKLKRLRGESQRRVFGFRVLFHAFGQLLLLVGWLVGLLSGWLVLA